MSPIVTQEYRIAGHYLSALINDDRTGLEDTDERDLDAFTNDAEDDARSSGLEPMHWTCEDGEADDWGRCAVSGLIAMRLTVILVCREGAQQ